jgi:hypothetical protein
MGGNEPQEYFLVSDRDEIVRAANFVVQKALAQLNVFESEAKILEDQLRAIEEGVKLRKIKTFINKQDS